MPNNWPRWGLACVAGLIFPLGLAPFDWWPLVGLSAGLLFFCLNPAHCRTPLRTGFFFGAGFFGAGVSWVYVSIHVYGNTPVPLATVLTVMFCGGLALLFTLQALLFNRLASRHLGWQVIQFASVWVLFEWVRSWLLTGFPWSYAGYGMLDSPFAGWIPVIGVYGSSWLIVLLGCLWVSALSRPQRAPRWIITLFCSTALWLSGSLWSGVQWTQPLGTPLRVAAVQPNVPLKEKWNPRYRGGILRDFVERSARLSESHDIVVWPESAIPGYRDQLEAVISQADQDATKSATTLITGIPTRDTGGRYNSVVALGNGSGTYNKQKLVPFGEYVPLEGWLRGLIAFFDLPMSQFSEGSSDQPPLMAHGLPVASLICYEVVYPDFVQRLGRDAALLITISNDTWFGDSVGPWQHFQMARYRAVEMGRDLIRSTNDGITALVDAGGRVIATSPQFTDAVVMGAVQPRTGHTPYTLTGSLPVLVFALITLVLGRDRP